MAHFINFVLQSLERNAPKPFMRPFEGDAGVFEWGLITYRDFLNALRVATAHWASTLASQGIKHGDVVGMWYVSPDTQLYA